MCFYVTSTYFYSCFSSLFYFVALHYVRNDPNFLNSPVFKQRTVVYPKLDGALPWRADGGGFLPAVALLVQELGYE
ncbi:hypothetical protein C7B70_13060 [Chlorogloea sp. CCALA 695]|nr:hypothetical protein C7B70_13060 [Chlorogloea sp. CCALA 695]